MALADPAPQAPDFQQTAQHSDLDRDVTTSDGDRRMQPVDVVLFALDSYTLDRADVAELAPVSEWAARHPSARIVVEGSADPTGTKPYNRELSRRRALAVRDALVADGVPESQIDLAFFGEDLPIAGPNANARRVRVWGQLPEAR